MAMAMARPTKATWGSMRRATRSDGWTIFTTAPSFLGLNYYKTEYDHCLSFCGGERLTVPCSLLWDFIIFIIVSRKHVQRKRPSQTTWSTRPNTTTTCRDKGASGLQCQLQCQLQCKTDSSPTSELGRGTFHQGSIFPGMF